jgi:hypothetical protein
MRISLAYFQLDLLNAGHVTCNHENYSLTCEQYERLLNRAKGHCELCGKPGFKSARGKLHIDHDHALGWHAVRGLLCNHCNTQFHRTWMDTPARTAYLSRAWHLNAQ